MKGILASLSWLALHFSLILLVCAHDTFLLLSHADTILPSSLQNYWGRAAQASGLGLGEGLPSSNLFRQGLVTYLHCAGIDGSYGFFAPSVPNSYKVVFEIQYPDGKVEYELPEIAGRASGVRLATLFTHIARTDYEPLRQTIFKMLAYSVWEKHPKASAIRSVFGYIKEPSPEEAHEGKRETYHVLYSYNFNFPSSDPAAETKP